MQSFGIAQQIGPYGTELASATYPLVTQPNFLASLGTQPVWAAATSAVAGTALCATITSTSPDFLISDLGVAYRDIAPLFG
jgi:hypothetical protein